MKSKELNLAAVEPKQHKKDPEWWRGFQDAAWVVCIDQLACSIGFAIKSGLAEGMARNLEDDGVDLLMRLQALAAFPKRLRRSHPKDWTARDLAFVSLLYSAYLK